MPYEEDAELARKTDDQEELLLNTRLEVVEDILAELVSRVEKLVQLM